ncbi:MAG: redoxin family protein [Candidatus Sulfotelmatobacter sp.]
MTISSPLKSGLLDVLTGFVGLVLFMVLVFGTNIKFDLRWFFIVGGSLCAGLGLLRGKSAPQEPWMKGVLIISGMAVPVLILSFFGIAFGANLVLAIFFAISTLMTLCGVQARRNWARGRRVTGVNFLLSALALIVSASMFVLPPLMGMLSGKHVDTPAPEFSLTTEDGKVVSSSALKGKVVVLAFWATWCEPCWQELPRIEKVYASYRSSGDVLFWAVDAHAGGDTEEIAQAFAKKMRLKLPVAFTENASAVQLGVNGYPTLVLLDASGRVRFIHDGYDGSERLESNLAQEISTALKDRM